MRTIVLIFESMDRWVLAEPLAYEVYRKAGNAASRTDFVRTSVDGRPLGYQLLIEVVNKGFLRHNELPTDGNLYKCQWFGNGVVGQHEKKTYIHDGHDDLVQLVAQLGKAKGDDQWAVIKKNFDVEQVINYFAVNTVLSHWDGYFNNYFTYHDVHGTGKWTMYPWDQDKTWGFHDAIQGYEVFFDMPLTFGMAGDRPPNWPKNQPVPPGFGLGAIWWRAGGHFSQPLLANPQFRKLYLAPHQGNRGNCLLGKGLLPSHRANGRPPPGRRGPAQITRDRTQGRPGTPAPQSRFAQGAPDQATGVPIEAR